MKFTTLTIVALFTCLHSTAQNVGIGIANPTRAKLEVHGATGATSAIFGGESSGVSLQRNWPGLGFNQYHNSGSRYIANGYASLIAVDPGSGHMVFDMFPNGAANNLASFQRRAMVVTHDGRVNIGSGDLPPATLNVARGTGVDGTAVFQGTTHRSHFNYSTAEDTYIRAGKNNGKVFLNDIAGGKVVMGSGNTFVGINSGDPTYPLEIRQVPLHSTWEKGLLLVSPMHDYSNWEIHATTNLLFSHNKYVRAAISPSTGAYSAVSDARLKKNIQPMLSILDKVKRLKPVQYEMKDNNPGHLQSIGFLAQEVQQLFPELVSVMKSGGNEHNVDHLQLLDYSGFGVIAIKAIQEQQAEIESLKKDNEAMKKRLETLERHLAVRQ